MKWRQKPSKPEPDKGSTRVIRRFCWWPLELRISDGLFETERETRWLCFAKVKQEYRHDVFDGFHAVFVLTTAFGFENEICHRHDWEDVCWEGT
jgi:hypothetical protein